MPLRDKQSRFPARATFRDAEREASVRKCWPKGPSTAGPDRDMLMRSPRGRLTLGRTPMTRRIAASEPTRDRRGTSRCAKIAKGTRGRCVMVPSCACRLVHIFTAATVGLGKREQNPTLGEFSCQEGVRADPVLVRRRVNGGIIPRLRWVARAAGVVRRGLTIHHSGGLPAWGGSHMNVPSGAGLLTRLFEPTRRGRSG